MNLKENGHDQDEMLKFAQELVRVESFSGQEKQVAHLIAERMKSLAFDEVTIDPLGSVLGRIGSGNRSLLFESHTDTVRVHDPDEWQYPPFSGTISDGCLWGRGSVDMKSSIAASIFAAVSARDAGYLDGKTVYVSCSVFEEDCDGEGINAMLESGLLKPEYAVICEPSSNRIVSGHKGKAQIILRTIGRSAHGSAPEKGVNAVYEMAEIIQRVEQTNSDLEPISGRKGSLVLSQITSQAVSLNAVPDVCEIYLDRRTVPGETIETIETEMQAIIAGKNAEWEIDTVKRTAWTGAPITYRPLHQAWQINIDHPLTQSCFRAYHSVFKQDPLPLGFWDFSTNAVGLIKHDIPCIGFGPGDPKQAHMRDESCPIDQIEDAFLFYKELIREF
jgi:putative selenium metabolism hydrolase